MSTDTIEATQNFSTEVSGSLHQASEYLMFIHKNLCALAIDPQSATLPSNDGASLMRLCAEVRACAIHADKLGIKLNP